MTMCPSSGMSPDAFFASVEDRQIASSSAMQAALGERHVADIRKTKEVKQMQGRWSPDEITIMRRRAEEGAKMIEVARELGRSETSIQQKASKLKIRFNGHAKRVRSKKPTEPAVKPQVEDETPQEQLERIAEGETCPESIAELEEDVAALGLDDCDPFTADALLVEFVETRIRLACALVDVSTPDPTKRLAILTELERVRELVRS